MLNGESFIAETLKSVNCQTYKNIEHLIIDGCSTDDTLHIIQKNRQKITNIFSEPDKGIYDAMNKGAIRSNGDIICFLNADDHYSSPQIIETVVKKFSEDSFDVVYGDIEYITTCGSARVIRKWQSGPYKKGLFSLGWAPPHPAFFARTDAFRELGGFQLKYKLAADTDLMIRMLELNNKKWSYIPQVMVKMRLGGATNKCFRNILQGNLEIWRSLSCNGLQPKLIPFIVNKAILKARHKMASHNLSR